MTDYEARFTAETGLDYKSTISAIPNDVEAYDDDFVAWLTQTADRYKAEIEKLKEDDRLSRIVYSDLNAVCLIERERADYQTSMAEKYKRERDELIELFVTSKSEHEVAMRFKDFYQRYQDATINRIREGKDHETI